MFYHLEVFWESWSALYYMEIQSHIMLARSSLIRIFRQWRVLPGKVGDHSSNVRNRVVGQQDLAIIRPALAFR
jgi:hypothetical protein